MTDNETLQQFLTPPVLAERGHFLVKLAENPHEIEAAQRLRFQVFMGEQGHLSDIAEHAAGLDIDEFDRFCLHLIIVNSRSGEVVGTYRVHPGVVASRGIGFYSEREYHIRGLEKIASTVIEVGRSCVSAEYRNGTVVALLWAGLAELHARSRCRYLLGCVSLETADPVIGRALYESLRRQDGIFSSEIEVAPRPGFELPEADGALIQEYLDGTRRDELAHWMPPLMKGYLRLGARLGGVPVLDREFGAIDFLVLFNFDEMNRKYARHFM